MAARDMEGKRVVVTGANTGIGKAAVEALAARGAEVWLCARDASRGEAARGDIASRLGDGVHIKVVKLDLGSIAGARKDAEALAALEGGDRIDVLVLNAGVMQTDGMDRQEQAEGIELQFGVNHCAHVVVEQVLRDSLARAGTAARASRVVVVGSGAERWAQFDLEDMNWERRDFLGGAAYGNSKLCNLMFARWLCGEYGRDSLPIVAYSLSPGIVMTELGRDWPIMNSFLGPLAHFAASLVMRTPEQGAATTVHCATAPELAPADNPLAGKYFRDEAPADPVNPLATDDEATKAMMELTKRVIQDAEEKAREAGAEDAKGAKDAKDEKPESPEEDDGEEEGGGGGEEGGDGGDGEEGAAAGGGGGE